MWGISTDFQVLTYSVCNNTAKGAGDNCSWITLSSFMIYKPLPPPITVDNKNSLCSQKISSYAAFRKIILDFLEGCSSGFIQRWGTKNSQWVQSCSHTHMWMNLWNHTGLALSGHYSCCSGAYTMRVPWCKKQHLYPHVEFSYFKGTLDSTLKTNSV